MQLLVSGHVSRDWLQRDSLLTSAISLSTSGKPFPPLTSLPFSFSHIPSSLLSLPFANEADLPIGPRPRTSIIIAPSVGGSYVVGPSYGGQAGSGRDTSLFVLSCSDHVPRSIDSRWNDAESDLRSSERYGGRGEVRRYGWGGMMGGRVEDDGGGQSILERVWGGSGGI